MERRKEHSKVGICRVLRITLVDQKVYTLAVEEEQVIMYNKNWDRG